MNQTALNLYYILQIIAIMKYIILLALSFSLSTGTNNVNAADHTDSSLAKKVLILEQKLAAQQKEINTLKANNATVASYTIDRRGSKQWTKKTN